jgi:hypothetical protein
MIKDVLKSMVNFKNTSQERFITSRKNTEDLEIVVEMEMVRRSGETSRPRASYETDASRLGPMRRTFSGRTDRSWKGRSRESTEWNGNATGHLSRDLERGQGVG